MMTLLKYNRFLLLPAIMSLAFTSCGIFDSGDDDPNMGDWTRVAYFEGIPRNNAVAFSIGGRGYVGTGYDSDNDERLHDFWEYDPESNWWVRKAEFPGAPRSAAVGFSIGGKGYIGTGYDGNDELNDFWEYDPQTDTWREVAPFGGSARYGAVAFVVGGKGYVGTGHDGNDLKDFWQYDPQTDEWTQIVSLPGNKRINASAFVIDDIAYVGTGRNSGTYEDDFWQYNSEENQWVRLEDLDDDHDADQIPRASATAFSMFGKGYIALGDRSGSQVDVWEYDPVLDEWARFADFEGPSRNGAVGFILGEKAYVGTGTSGSVRLDDFWEFDPAIENNDDT